MNSKYLSILIYCIAIFGLSIAWFILWALNYHLNLGIPLGIVSGIILPVLIAIIILLVENIITIYSRRSDFQYLVHDDWVSYGYTTDIPIENKYSSKLNPIPKEGVKCRLVHSEYADLEMYVSKEREDGSAEFEWKGMVTMNSPNEGSLAYYHIKDSNDADNGVDSVGYKKITAFKHADDSGKKTTRIYITQSDRNLGFGREVFIRDA